VISLRSWSSCVKSNGEGRKPCFLMHDEKGSKKGLLVKLECFG